MAQPLVGELPQPQQPQLPGAAASTTWPSPQEPLPPQQAVKTQQPPLLWPPEEVGGDKHEEVVVSKNMVVEIGRVMARDGEKGMMGSMKMGKENELLHQQSPQQLPQLPGAADPDPWPPPTSADLDENNSKRGIGRRDFLPFVLGGRAAAGSFALGKSKAKGRQSDREQDGSDWKRERIGTGWSFSIFGGWGTRRLLGALLVRGEHVYAKRGDLRRASRSKRHVLISSTTYSSSSSIKTCMLVDW